MKKFFVFRKAKRGSVYFLGLPIVIIGLLIISSVPFQSCKPNDDDVPDTIVAYKPNIYIYPEEKTTMNIQLDFPQGGEIIAAIPNYDKWENITVEKTGLINNSYNYLFYESKQPDKWQYNEGWIIKQVDLKSFFEKNLQEYGFRGQEIQDFIDYWIPRLTDSEYYAIYPQNKATIDNVIQITFSKEPDNLLRLFYLIEEASDMPNNELDLPMIKIEFERDGFFVTEWGVLLNE